MSNFRHSWAASAGPRPGRGRGALAALLLVLGTCAVHAEEPGAELAWKYHCITCHGERGKSNAARYPNLAGQNPAYIVARLKYFRAGAEPGNQMNAQAAPLTDEEMQILADHFSTFPR